MGTMTAPPPPPFGGPSRPPAVDPARARRWLLGVFWAITFALGIGFNWDRAWHATHAFDGFWSPPHLVIYGALTVGAQAFTRIILTPRLRRAFGSGFRVPVVPFTIPGALALLGGGFALVGLGGAVLDNLWHTAFGLDETAWSLPHAMIGWGIATLALGFVASRLALRASCPLRLRTILLLGWLLLAFSAGPILGPFRGNATPGRVGATALLPGLATQPDAQHTYRIYLVHNLTRTNPLFVPLAALWAGCGLAAVRGLDRRARTTVAVVTLWSALTLLAEWGAGRRFDHAFGLALAREPANWAPVPILPAALLLLAAGRVGLAGRWAWLLAGLIFGACAVPLYTGGGRPGLVALAAIPALALGAAIGRWLAQTLHTPTVGRVAITLGAGLVTPLATGAIDLWLRSTTP